jgi:hypothetical protein
LGDLGAGGRMILKQAFYKYLRFNVLAALKMSIVVFWDVTPCNLEDGYQLFGRTYCTHLWYEVTNFILKMEAINSCETLVTTYKTA